MSKVPLQLSHSSLQVPRSRDKRSPQSLPICAGLGPAPAGPAASPVPPPSPWQRADQWRARRMFTGRGVAAATREASRSRYLTPRGAAAAHGGHGPARAHGRSRHGLPRHPGASFSPSLLFPYPFFLFVWGVFYLFVFCLLVFFYLPSPVFPEASCPVVNFAARVATPGRGKGMRRGREGGGTGRAARPKPPRGAVGLPGGAAPVMRPPGALSWPRHSGFRVYSHIPDTGLPKV